VDRGGVWHDLLAAVTAHVNTAESWNILMYADSQLSAEDSKVLARKRARELYSQNRGVRYNYTIKMPVRYGLMLKDISEKQKISINKLIFRFIKLGLEKYALS
jgi:hypothetical protein